MPFYVIHFISIHFFPLSVKEIELRCLFLVMCHKKPQLNHYYGLIDVTASCYCGKCDCLSSQTNQVIMISIINGMSSCNKLNRAPVFILLLLWVPVVILLLLFLNLSNYRPQCFVFITNLQSRIYYNQAVINYVMNPLGHHVTATIFW